MVYKLVQMKGMIRIDVLYMSWYRKLFYNQKSIKQIDTKCTDVMLNKEIISELFTFHGKESFISCLR